MLLLDIIVFQFKTVFGINTLGRTLPLRVPPQSTQFELIVFVTKDTERGYTACHLCRVGKRLQSLVNKLDWTGLKIDSPTDNNGKQTE